LLSLFFAEFVDKVVVVDSSGKAFLSNVMIGFGHGQWEVKEIVVS